VLQRRRPALPVAAGIVLAVAAAVTLAVRVPTAIDSFRSTAAAQAGRGELGGALAVADMVGIDNDFVRAAVDELPRNAQFAPLLPDPAQAQQTYGVSAETIDALAPLMQEVLLPRREVDAASTGTYILCYLCETSSWDKRTHWLWKGTKGDSIGLVYRG
jgi:hypothetical protein